MISLLILVLFGTGLTIFAIQNTQAASIVFGNLGLVGIPQYVVTFSAMVYGVFLSWVVRWLFRSRGFISTSTAIRKKQGNMHDAKKHVCLIEEQNHELEKEVNRLQGEKRTIILHLTPDHEEQRSLIPATRDRQRLS